MFETKEDTQGPNHPQRTRPSLLGRPRRPAFLPDPPCAQISLTRASRGDLVNLSDFQCHLRCLYPTQLLQVRGVGLRVLRVISASGV